MGVLRLPHLVAHIAETRLSQDEAPLLVVQGSHVLDANATARRAGVKAGMSLPRARARCPHARVLDPAVVPYEEALTALAARLGPLFPRLETSLATGMVLLTVDLAHLPASAREEAVREAGRTAYRHTGVVPAAGLARGKFTARVVAGIAPLGKGAFVPAGRERSFLASFPIATLPLDEESARAFHLLGLRTLGDLAALPARAVLSRFGTHGLFLHRLARGEDDRSVAAYQARPRVQVRRDLEAPLARREDLDALFTDMAREAGHRLAADGWAARRVRLVLAQEHGGPRGRILTLRSPASRGGRLAAVLREMAARVRLTAGVVAAVATFDRLVPHLREQLPLLPEVTPPADPWADLVADLAARYGRGRFFRVALADVPALLPEERVRLEEVRT